MNDCDHGLGWQNSRTNGFSGLDTCKSEPVDDQPPYCEAFPQVQSKWFNLGKIEYLRTQSCT